MVHLERSRPIALLEQRSVAVVAAWLRKHPTIEVVARDRSEEFAAAIREALPYSTGPVEGHINRLKLLKRQSYGRVGGAHLSRRLLAA